MIKGRDISLYLDGVELAHGRGYDLELSQDYIRAASEYSRTGKVIPTEYTMKVSAEWLFSDETAFLKLEECDTNGTQIEMRIGLEGASHSCKAYVDTMRRTGSIGKLQILTATMVSSGVILDEDDFLPYVFMNVLYTRFDTDGQVLKTNGYVQNGVLKFR